MRLYTREVIPTFAQAFPDLDWGKLADVAEDPETVGLTLIPRVTALISRPYPEPPESRIVAPEVLGKIYDAVDECRADELPAGLSKRWAPVAAAPDRDFAASVARSRSRPGPDDRVRVPDRRGCSDSLRCRGR